MSKLDKLKKEQEGNRGAGVKLEPKRSTVPENTATQEHKGTETQDETQRHKSDEVNKNTTNTNETPSEEKKTTRKKADPFNKLVNFFMQQRMQITNSEPSVRQGVDIGKSQKVKINEMTNAFYDRTGMKLTIKQVVEHAINTYVDENYDTYVKK